MCAHIRPTWDAAAGLLVLKQAGPAIVFLTDVRFGSKADIEVCLRNIRFTPKADIVRHDRDVRFVQVVSIAHFTSWASRNHKKQQ